MSSLLQKRYPKDSGTVAGDRRFDVYMGIDVWGRGTFGGGKWNVSSLYGDQPHKRQYRLSKQVLSMAKLYLNSEIAKMTNASRKLNYIITFRLTVLKLNEVYEMARCSVIT